jgi:hypothetical protein
MQETDQYYIGRCLDGHPDDFRYLVRRYQAALLAHLAGKLGNKDKAEEAAQETLVRAYFNMDRLKKPQSFFFWLLGIADHVAKEHRREEQIRRQREAIRRITLWNRQLPGCLRIIGKSFCYGIMLINPAIRLQKVWRCLWAPLQKRYHGPTLCCANPCSSMLKLMRCNNELRRM